MQGRGALRPKCDDATMERKKGRREREGGEVGWSRLKSSEYFCMRHEDVGTRREGEGENVRSS